MKHVAWDRISEAGADECVNARSGWIEDVIGPGRLAFGAVFLYREGRLRPDSDVESVSFTCVCPVQSRLARRSPS